MTFWMFIRFWFPRSDASLLPLLSVIGMAMVFLFAVGISH